MEPVQNERSRESRGPERLRLRRTDSPLLLFILLLTVPVLALASEAGLGIEVGSRVPKSPMVTAAGERIELTRYAKSQKKKNLLLLFFRTGTCGFCVSQLIDFGSHLPEIAERNAAVLAISLDDAIVQARTSERIEKKFPILLDPDAKVVKQFDVFNPDDRLARPSIFVIGSNAKVLYKYVGRSLSDRPLITAVLDVLSQHSGRSGASAARGVAGEAKK